jgi:hypothetical protein
MRAGLLIRAPLALLLLAGCKTYKTGSGNFPPPDYDAMSFEAAPGRQIFGVDGLVGSGGGGGTGGAGGEGQVGQGGAAGRSSDAAVDGTASGSDARAAGDGGCTPCDLINQNCPVTQGCYPAGGGRACCMQRGSTGPLAPCGESAECDRGLVCVAGAAEPVCQPVCNVSSSVCVGGTCRALAGYPPAGYCAP